MVLSRAFQGDIELCISAAVLTEYESVLRRPRFKLTADEIDVTLTNIRKVGRLVSPPATLKISDHEPDNRFYECADAAGADYIVTGNTKHFRKGYKKTKIINGRQLLELLAEGEN